ncbi:MAG: acetyl-CoA C-acetyltransferase [candidate division Zixibacteria bacterium]|nr:acetyl-CoA C-acetyltransferase [candidate division Zixibacteria bacterium]
MSEFKEVVILSACRTPIGTFLGGLSDIPAPKLGSVVIKEAVKRAGVKSEDIDEVIMGMVVQAGAGQAPARQAAIYGGVPPTAGAITINKVCGSGLKAVMMAAQAIKCDDAELIVAGGMESMSQVPYVVHKARKGFKFGDQKIVDTMISDGLWDSFNNFHMGVAAELTATKAKLTREMLDEYAANSQQKGAKAIEEGKFKEEIVPVEIPQRRGDPVIFDTDEGPRAGTTAEKLARLKPAFQKDGIVTAGNSPGLNDGASAVVVTSMDYAKANNLKPIAKVLDYAVSGTLPEDLFFAPIYAVKKLMDKMNVDINYWDLIEANEAFAAQCLADGNELGWDYNKVNVNGGAIALGHPIGASGARVLTTLIYALKDRGLTKGLTTLCLGGGNAVAMAIEIL